MASAVAVIRQAGEGEYLWFAGGGLFTMKATSTETGGAFALFEPSQQSLLYQHIIAPEGRLHFAGEHASLCHAWIQGAIESGLRAALEINAIGGA